MSWGFEGPIRSAHLIDYAIARTFRIQSAARNYERVSCKACGLTIECDHGHEIWAYTLGIRQYARCYFCPQCFDIVLAAATQFPDWPEGKRPPWWEKLTQPARTKEQVLADRRATGKPR